MVRPLAALVVIVALSATACTQNLTATKASPTAAVSPSKLAWTDCGDGFVCATVTVPLDYAHPNAGTIDIAINRKPATDSANRIGSLLINPGGPGDSGVDWVHESALGLSRLNRQFDLIGFDPRGVGRSAPIHCLDGPQADAYNALDSVLDDPQEKNAAIQAFIQFAAACQQNSGRVLPFVDTASAAKDMDLIRAALGDPKLTYLGLSYGTFLGEMYAHLFPTHIRAIVLDSVVDPAVDFNSFALAQTVGFELNLQAFLADCRARKSATPPCTFARSGDPGTKLAALLQRLDTTPLMVGNRQLTRALAISGTLMPGLYYQEWAQLDQALTQADQGNGRLLLANADMYYQRNPDGTYSNVGDASSAIDCLDHPVPSDIAFYDRLGPAFAKASPLFGPANQYATLGCAYWPVKPTRQAGPLTADGAPPILVVGGTGDPATPYEWAQSVHRQLTSSVLVTRQGVGHGSYGVSLCATLATNAYLINLTVPADGTICSS